MKTSEERELEELQNIPQFKAKDVDPRVLI